MEFGILVWDDGLPEFSGWERKLGYGQGGQASVYWQLDSSIINVEIKIARKYIKFQYIKDIGKKAHALTDLIFTSYSQ